MRLSKFLKIEFLGIQKYYRDVHQEIYSHMGILHSAEGYQFILSPHSKNINERKARLEVMMDLTDIKEG